MGWVEEGVEAGDAGAWAGTGDEVQTRAHPLSRHTPADARERSGNARQGVGDTNGFVALNMFSKGLVGGARDMPASGWGERCCLREVPTRGRAVLAVAQ